MGKFDKTFAAVLSGESDANIDFSDLCNLLFYLGFTRRIRGDHYIFTRIGIAEILNLQPRGSKAKSYQVRQVRGIIRGYKLRPANE